jgi:hypothetical protein
MFEVTKGTIEYKPGEPGSVKADITIESKSVNTRIGRRDDDLRSDNFFSAQKFPTLTFRSKRVQNVRAEGFDLGGDLTIRDVTREVVLKVEGPSAPIRDRQCDDHNQPEGLRDPVQPRHRGGWGGGRRRGEDQPRGRGDREEELRGRSGGPLV